MWPPSDSKNYTTPKFWFSNIAWNASRKKVIAIRFQNYEKVTSVWLQNYEKSHRVQISAKLVECESALHRLQNYVEAMESPVSHIVGIGRTRFSNGLESGSRCCEFTGEKSVFHIVGSRCGKVIFLILVEVQSGWKSLFAWCWELVESRFSPPDSKIMRKWSPSDFKIMRKLPKVQNYERNLHPTRKLWESWHFMKCYYIIILDGVFLFFYGTQSRLIYRQTQYELYYPPMFASQVDLTSSTPKLWGKGLPTDSRIKRKVTYLHRAQSYEKVILNPF